MNALAPVGTFALASGTTKECDPNSETLSTRRRWPVGAEVLGDGRTHFRLWAPKRNKVEIVLESEIQRSFPMSRLEGGYYTAVLETGAGTRYRFRLDDSEMLYPDPASRFQPEGPFGPSEVIDFASFPWSDSAWKGLHPEGCVLYEMHIGTFTREGTWKAAMEQLPRLADVGINALEVMPVAEFPGSFGWGYDGVSLFASTRLYGRPEDFCAFVDRAHALGIGVILDVVYNHFGPDGNFLKEFSAAYFSDKYKTDWGEAINYDGPDSGPVRDFFLSNAASWIALYHLDGLRLDATQNIYDNGEGEHILAGISRVTREAAGERSIILVAENEPQETKLVRSRDVGGFGLDMLWNDDFHHTARVALTGKKEAYYADHLGRPQELISAMKYGYLFQGQYYTWQKQGRGTPSLDLAPTSFVTFLDNHDQVANSGAGLRSHALTSPGRYRAMTAFLLLGPSTPMLFQGQEFASSAPFFYFADHKPELAKLVRDGRVEFLSQFPSLAQAEGRPAIPDPHDRATFERCKLDLDEVKRNDWAVELHRDLMRLRREDPTFRRQKMRSLDGAVLGPEALVLRFFGEDPRFDRLLLLNLGHDIDRTPMPEPLLAPPFGSQWKMIWSSDNAKYGGTGVSSLDLKEEVVIPGHAAFVFVTEKATKVE